MTLEDLARRLGTVLVVSSMGVLFVALMCGVGGSADMPVVQTIHHLFGVALAVLGFVMLIVALALLSLAPPPKSSPKAGSTHQRDVLGWRKDAD